MKMTSRGQELINEVKDLHEVIREQRFELSFKAKLSTDVIRHSAIDDAIDWIAARAHRDYSLFDCVDEDENVYLYVNKSSAEVFPAWRILLKIDESTKVTQIIDFDIRRH